MWGEEGEDGLFVLLPKKPRESKLNIWCSWFWRGGISQHPPHSLMSARLPDSPCSHSHQLYFLFNFFFFLRPEIACMKFWQAWQHHVSSKAFQHKQEKNNKKWKWSIILWLTKEQFVCNSAQWFGQLIKLLCQSKTLRTLTSCSTKHREGSWLAFWQPSLRNWKNCLANKIPVLGDDKMPRELREILFFV